MRKLLVALVSAGSLAAPAAAVEVEFGIAGGITVYPDLTSCASLSFPGPTTFVGAFTASGFVQGPGTLVGAARGATPIVVVGGTSWFGCLPGGYPEASVGSAVYTLSGSTGATDYAEIKHCTVRSGRVVCI